MAVTPTARPKHKHEVKLLEVAPKPGTTYSVDHYSKFSSNMDRMDV
jgi:hypothetical protein